MADLGNLLGGIEEKLKTILNENGRLREELGRSQKEVRDLIRLLDEKTKLNQQLQNQLESITVARSLGSELGNEKGKERVQELLREIDRCIGMLSRS